MPYHSLIVRWRDHNDWTPEFGDYDKDVVEKELLDEYIHSCYECRIVTTEDDQDSVVEMIHQLNGVAVI